MIKLIHETHTYVNDQRPNQKFISVTTLLGEYKEKFDEHYHAQRVADRKGVEKEQILAEWKEINRVANEYGTALHEILERYLLAKKNLYVPRDNFEKTVINAFKECCGDEKLTIIGSETVYAERVMSYDFGDLLGIAGTSDIIEDIDKDRFNVWDFKSNKKFNYDNEYAQYLYFPVDHLVYSQYTTYCLQISIYGLMYERETGKKFNRGGLFYWDRNICMFKMIPVPYMKKEAELIIQHYKLKIGL
jgi:hypothetical protein